MLTRENATKLMLFLRVGGSRWKSAKNEVVGNDASLTCVDVIILNSIPFVLHASPIRILRCWLTFDLLYPVGLPLSSIVKDYESQEIQKPNWRRSEATTTVGQSSASLKGLCPQNPWHPGRVHSTFA